MSFALSPTDLRTLFNLLEFTPPKASVWSTFALLIGTTLQLAVLLTPSYLLWFRPSRTTSWTIKRRSEALARLGLCAAEVFGWILVLAWRTQREVDQLRRVVQRKGYGENVVIVSQPPVGEVIESKTTMTMEDEMEVLEGKRGGSPVRHHNEQIERTSRKRSRNELFSESGQDGVGPDEPSGGLLQAAPIHHSAQRVESETPLLDVFGESVLVLKSENMSGWYPFLLFFGSILLAFAAGVRL